MKFLCGRPGCGKESTATLQIDAPSTTVSLVDPRISRDGVPLCARHADATTPPMGWTMNDLRSRSRSLAAVPDEGSVPTSTPPRDRRESEEQAGRRMSRRQSIAERAKRAAADGQPIEEQMPLPVSEDDSKFASSRPATERVSAEAAKQELTEQELHLLFRDETQRPLRSNRKRFARVRGLLLETQAKRSVARSDVAEHPPRVHKSAAELSSLRRRFP